MDLPVKIKIRVGFALDKIRLRRCFHASPWASDYGGQPNRENTDNISLRQEHKSCFFIFPGSQVSGWLHPNNCLCFLCPFCKVHQDAEEWPAGWGHMKI